MCRHPRIVLQEAEVVLILDQESIVSLCLSLRASSRSANSLHILNIAKW